MPTYARRHQLANALTYHIYSRSNAKIPIFKCPDDFLHFMGLLKDYSSRFSLKIYHWVIMINHYHLLLELADPEMISKVMAGLSKAYSCYHHKVYSLPGFLWQGRFKLQPVQKERYLIACGRYIERNPLRAGLVEAAHEYPYSSAKFYAIGKQDDITTEDPAFAGFGKDLVSSRNNYIKFLQDFDEEDTRKFSNLEEPVGNKDFIKRLVKVRGRFMPRRRGRLSERIV